MLFLLAALASTPPSTQAIPADALTTLSSGYTKVSGVVTEELSEAINARNWRQVATIIEKFDRNRLSGVEQREADFLWIWAQIHAGTAERGEPRLSALDGLLSVPKAYLDLARGEVLVAVDKPLEALASLDGIPPTSPLYERSVVLLAKALKELNRSAEATAMHEEVAGRPDPSAGSSLSIYALALAKGPGSAAAYPYLRRLWTHYPATTEGRRAAKALAAYSGSKYAPTADEVSLRAEALMNASQYSEAIAAADGLLSKGLQKDQATCRALYTRGRSYYKQNQLSASVTGQGDAGDRCVGIDGDYGPRALYLLGTAQFRRKHYAESAAAWLKIPGKYPEHSMADDGYTHAGISLQEGDQLEEAQKVWRKALDELPNGDTVPEATWRLAWSLYLSGDTAQARQIATRLGALAVDDHENLVHVEAGRYWAARWAVYPDVNAPTVVNEAGRAEAVAGFVRLIETTPWSFYAILAASRLKELDPTTLARLQKLRPAGELKRPWEARVEILESEPVRDGVALARLGLAREAKAEWARYEGEFTPDEAAWLHSLRGEAGDWLLAHSDLRRWMRDHPLGTMGEGERAVVRVAYPDRYWTEVQTAAKGYLYEPRLFHSLVREESNFNRRIVSFAGARGLSQLMPATAKSTAGWMGRTVTMDDLFEPEKNLPIGARYLESVIKGLDGSPYCALAGYNAGPGRVKQWKGEWGNVPTDEYVERIPFRETRGYVKRVMGTWQTYRWFIDEGDPFPDLSAFNHKMLPKQ